MASWIIFIIYTLLSIYSYWSYHDLLYHYIQSSSTGINSLKNIHHLACFKKFILSFLSCSFKFQLSESEKKIEISSIPLHCPKEIWNDDVCWIIVFFLNALPEFWKCTTSTKVQKNKHRNEQKQWWIRSVVNLSTFSRYLNFSF